MLRLHEEAPDFNKVLQTLNETKARMKKLDAEFNKVSCLNDFIFVAEALLVIEDMLHVKETQSVAITKHWKTVLAARVDLMESLPDLQYLSTHKLPMNQLALQMAAYCDQKTETRFKQRWQALRADGKTQQAIVDELQLHESMLCLWLASVDMDTFKFVMSQIVPFFESNPVLLFELSLISFMRDEQLEWFTKAYQEPLIKPVKKNWMKLIKPKDQANQHIALQDYPGTSLLGYYSQTVQRHLDTDLFDKLISSTSSSQVNPLAVANLCQVLVFSGMDFSTKNNMGNNRFVHCCKYHPLVARRMLAVILELSRAGAWLSQEQLQEIIRPVISKILAEMRDNDLGAVLKTVECKTMLLVFMCMQHSEKVDIPMELVDPVDFFNLKKCVDLFACIYRHVDRRLFNDIILEAYENDESINQTLAEQLFYLPDEMSLQMVEDMFDVVFKPLFHDYQEKTASGDINWNEVLAIIMQKFIINEELNANPKKLAIPGVLFFKQGVNQDYFCQGFNKVTAHYKKQVVSNDFDSGSQACPRRV